LFSRSAALCGETNFTEVHVFNNLLKMQNWKMQDRKMRDQYVQKTKLISFDSHIHSRSPILLPQKAHMRLPISD